MGAAEHARHEIRPSARLRTLDELYEEHAPGLRRRCLRLTRDPHAAEDLMQEVFVRFLARFPEAPADMNVAGYLYATARNILWKQLRDDHEVADGDIESSAGSDDDLEIDPERSLLLVEQQRLVRRCSAVLTGRQRRALTLREVEGHSYAEIGDDLGIGTDAVAQVISRARVRLRVAVRRAHVDLDQLSPECRAMLGPLSDYLDGHAAKGSSDIESHLAECESCRSTLSAFKGAGSRLRGLLPAAPLAGIVARLGEAVRLGGGGPVDVVRAASVVVAAALAIGGSSMVAVHELDSSPGGRGAVAHAVSTAKASSSPLRASATPSHTTSATPSATRPQTPAVSGQGGTALSAPVRGGNTPALTPTVTKRPAAVTSAATPSTTPGSTPVVTTRPPSQGGAGSPAVTPPVDPSSVTPVVDTVVTPVVHKLVAPIAEKVVDKVVVPVVTKAVTPVTAPVTKALTPVTTPVSKAVTKATDPVTKALEPVTTPVTNAVAPVTEPVTKVVDAVVPPAATTPAAPATTPAVTVPATPPTTQAPKAPAIDIPSLNTKIG